MEFLAASGGTEYHRITAAAEFDRLTVPVRGLEEPEGFGYFRTLGMVDYLGTFKAWMRRFPRPTFLVAVQDERVVSWVYIEGWFEAARDGEPVHVLRSIETLPNQRGRKVGFRMLALGLRYSPGYMITKPMNKDAERFFFSSGFLGEADFPRCPVDLSSHHGYVVMPPFRKHALLGKVGNYFDRTRWDE